MPLENPATTNAIFYGCVYPVSVVLVYLSSRGRRSLCFRVESFYSRIARRTAAALALVFCVSLVVSVAIGLRNGIPEPTIHDEFSYALAGDTFAHGRLTNEPHPMWIHFESMHILQQPTYASKYPPGQGLALAVGQRLGHPILGVWLSTAAACAAICWMLIAWLPSRWALVGGLLAAFHPLVLTWSQSFWGGAVAMLGGALALGGWMRLMRAPKARDSLLMGLGMAVLANSRPYEGAVMSASLLVILGFDAMKQGQLLRPRFLRRTVLPFVGVMAVTAAWMGYYNWRVTGNPMRMPYMLHAATYQVSPIFLWQKPPPEPHYNHDVMREHHAVWELEGYTKQTTLRGFARGIVVRFWHHLRDVLSPWFLVVPLCALPWAFGAKREVKLALLICGISAVALLLVCRTQSHYVAPAFGLFFFLAAGTMRYLSIWQRRKRIGQFLARSCVVLSLMSAFYTTATLAHGLTLGQARAQLIGALQSGGHKHLVVVRYSPQHNAHEEWVYNEAEIDAASVVWAREMDAAHNRQLLDFFKGRRAWLFEPDVDFRRLVPYPDPAAHASE